MKTQSKSTKQFPLTERRMNIFLALSVLAIMVFASLGANAQNQPAGLTAAEQAAQIEKERASKAHMSKGLIVGGVGTLAYGSAGLFAWRQCAKEDRTSCLLTLSGALLIPPTLMAMTGVIVGEPKVGGLTAAAALVAVPLIGVGTAAVVV